MSDLPTPPDQAARDQATDPSRSCIVQAPAGAGKTTLLAHRFVRLLESAQRPEEVLAITFTIKAAAEMKKRVLDLLAESSPLAERVLKRAVERDWHLLENPNVLKIQTIDSFALDIAKRAPGTQNLSGYDIVENAEQFYISAAESLINRLSHADPTAYIIADFLAFLDNDADKLVRLVTTMLGKRDQWLALVRTVSQPGNEQRMVEILKQTVSGIRATEEASLHAKLTPTDLEWLSSLSSDPSGWQVLVGDLMTQANKLRKKIPTDLVPDKALRKTANHWLSSVHERNLASALERYVDLPDHNGFDTDAKLLQTCCISLALAAMELDATFTREGIIDFTGLLLSAKQALRDEQGAATDLALLLDYRIKHILVDEFQDTSRGQLELFEMLLEPWQPNDGNTFFAVGDPMQSIYRFRDAEVAIFAEAKSQGVAALPLENCDLRANFRSDPTIVDWVNTLWADPQTTAAQNDIAYQSAIAMRQHTASAQVSCLAFTSPEAELSATIEHIKALQMATKQNRPNEQDKPAQTAILCRSRAHVVELLQALEENGIPWQATDIDLLQNSPVVMDLLAGLQVIVNPEQQKSWFTILRCPMFGAPLDDLLDLAEPSVHANIADSDQAYLQRLAQAYKWARSLLYEISIREVLEGFWLRCGGADAYTNAELEDALMFFDLLDSVSPERFTLKQIEHEIARLFAQNQTTANLHVLTIHKAKGLEYDHVVIPRLEGSTRNDSADLLLWQLTNSGLLMGLKGDSAHDWLGAQNRQHSRAEEQRLLYVACTRAKTSLYLSYTANEDRKPGGLANYLHEVASAAATSASVINKYPNEGTTDLTGGSTGEQTEMFAQRYLHRLPPNYSWSPPPPTDLPQRDKPARDEDIIADPFAVQVGNLVHRVLDFCAQQERTQLDKAELKRLLEHWITPFDEQLAAIVTAQVLAFMATELAQWVLFPHPQHESESAYQVFADGEVATIVLDRMFVDNGTRWIIDYKTSQHTELRIEELRERYRGQLQRYARTMQALFPEPIQTALLFVDISHLERLDS